MKIKYRLFAIYLGLVLYQLNVWMSIRCRSHWAVISFECERQNFAFKLNSEGQLTDGRRTTQLAISRQNKTFLLVFGSSLSSLSQSVLSLIRANACPPHKRSCVVQYGADHKFHLFFILFLSLPLSLFVPPRLVSSHLVLNKQFVQFINVQNEAKLNRTPRSPESKIATATAHIHTRTCVCFPHSIPVLRPITSNNYFYFYFRFILFAFASDRYLRLLLQLSRKLRPLLQRRLASAINIFDIQFDSTRDFCSSHSMFCAGCFRPHTGRRLMPPHNEIIALQSMHDGGQYRPLRRRRWRHTMSGDSTAQLDRLFI